MTNYATNYDVLKELLKHYFPKAFEENPKAEVASLDFLQSYYGDEVYDFFSKPYIENHNTIFIDKNHHTFTNLEVFESIQKAYFGDSPLKDVCGPIQQIDENGQSNSICKTFHCSNCSIGKKAPYDFDQVKKEK